MATEITIPHKFEPREYQLPFLRAMDNGAKRAVIIWHRRSGKDKVTLNFLIKKMIERKGTYYYFFPTYEQGKKILWDGMDKNGFKFMDHFPKELVASKNETEKKVTLINGSIFQIIGTDKIDSIVGTNPIGCVFSEYPLQSPEAWDFIRPILAENGGWAVFDYTPRGMNHGWKLLQQAKENGWFWQVLTVEDTKAVPQQVLDEEKAQMPEALFRQEYYCDFVDGAGAFFRRIENNVWDGDLQPEDGNQYQMGVDLGKYNDFTVLTQICLNDFRVGKQERFNLVDYNLQKARIEASWLRYGKPIARIDSTGLGDPICDDLIARGINVEPYRFTEQSRMDLLNHLAIMLEQDLIKIPNDDILIGELRSFQYVREGDRGKLKVKVPEGLHDDAVMSLALAVWGLREPIGLNRRGFKREEDVNIYKSNYK